jgi:hypothetical protein
VLVEKEIGSRNLIVSERYPKWHNRGVINIVEASESVGTEEKE